MEITLAKGGTDERRVNVDDIHIPDLWHIAAAVSDADPESSEKILETWHLAHHMLKALKEIAAATPKKRARKKRS